MRVTGLKRRIAAGAALLGWPLLAGAQDAAKTIVCTAEAGTPGETTKYRGTFAVVGGKLRESEPGWGVAVTRPLAKFDATGYAAAGDEVRFGHERGGKVGERYWLAGEVSGARIADFDCTPSAIRKCGLNPLTGPFTAEIYRGNTLAGTLPFTPKVSTSSARNSMSFDIAWTSPADRAVLAGKGLVVLKSAGDRIATFTIDGSRVEPRAFIARQHPRFRGAAYQPAPAGGKATPPECGDSACFLTTAAVHTVGLADDCWELRTLRAFRDGPLRALPGGAALIAEYYATAPALVAAVAARGDARATWLRTYWGGIVPSALLARIGAHRAALGVYAAMTRRLARVAAGG